MKRLFLLFSLAIVSSCFFSSCKKCYTCDFGSRGERELCSKDFPDGMDGLNMTIDAYEKQGYKCTAK